MASLRPFYVYHLTDSLNGTVFYVGKGKGRRVASHENEAKRGSLHPKCARIREIWGLGGRVERVIVQDRMAELDAYLLEADEINRIGLESLTNLIPGNQTFTRNGRKFYRPAPPIESSKDEAAGALAAMATVLRHRAQHGSASHFGALIDVHMAKRAPDVVARISKAFGVEFVRQALQSCGVELVMQ